MYKIYFIFIHLNIYLYVYFLYIKVILYIYISHFKHWLNLLWLNHNTNIYILVFWSISVTPIIRNNILN